MLYSGRDFATAAVASRQPAADLPIEGGHQMFGIGYQEMFVILVVALVVFGPARLPELAGQVGRWVRDFRRMSSDLTGEFEKTFAEVDEVKKSFQREMRSIQEEVEGVGQSTKGDLKKLSGKSPAAAKKASAKAASSTASTSSSRREAKSARSKASLGGNGGPSVAKVLSLPAPSKEDPLSDVSYFDLDGDLAVVAAGAAAGANGASADGRDALSRVRRRRAAAAYASMSSPKAR
jgi:Tat protein translocase TatB subunit